MTRNAVLTTFHLPTQLYAPDVRAIMTDTIQRYGTDEWRLIVMTNEIHGHLGIYSTLGAKMGLHALSLLQGQGQPHILTYAGQQPPLSCLNDGLQISTGSTLGHGLITLSPDPYTRVEALFTQGTQALRLRLKPQYQEQIAQDIQHGTQLYGRTQPYWQYVRTLALRYWSQWDRRHIFAATWE